MCKELPAQYPSYRGCLLQGDNQDDKMVLDKSLVQALLKPDRSNISGEGADIEKAKNSSILSLTNWQEYPDHGWREGDWRASCQEVN